MNRVVFNGVLNFESFIYILNHYLNSSLINFCIAISITKDISSYIVTIVVWNLLGTTANN